MKASIPATATDSMTGQYFSVFSKSKRVPSLGYRKFNGYELLWQRITTVWSSKVTTWKK